MSTLTFVVQLPVAVLVIFSENIQCTVHISRYSADLSEALFQLLCRYVSIVIGVRSSEVVQIICLLGVYGDLQKDVKLIPRYFLVTCWKNYDALL